MSPKIVELKSRQVFDSRGFPTVETDVILSDGSKGSSIVPSGASTGSYEAHELRDQNNDYLNKSVFKAVENVNGKINKLLNNMDPFNQEKIDNTLIDLDGSNNKSNIGANAILSVSIANCKAAAKSKKKEVYEYLSKNENYKLPYPLMNIINGGAHANNSLDIQEFMIRPDGAKNFEEFIKFFFIKIQNLKKNLKKKNLSTNVGDEGGFAPNLDSDEEAIELILESITESGFKPGSEINLCLDIAANELYKNNEYVLNKKNHNCEDLIQHYENLVNKYPIKSLRRSYF